MMPVATTGTDHYDALIGIIAEINSLQLKDLPNIGDTLPLSKIYGPRWLPSQRATLRPCVVVSAIDMPENVDIEDDQDDILVYPCMVTVLIDKQMEDVLKEPEMRWRQQI